MTVHPYTRVWPGKLAAPTVNDDETSNPPYEVGDIWVYGSNIYQATDVTDGAAVWSLLNGSTSGADLASLIHAATAGGLTANDEFVFWEDTSGQIRKITWDNFLVTLVSANSSSHWWALWGHTHTGFISVNVDPADPTVDDDEDLGYEAGDVWINGVTENAFLLTNEADGAAAWRKLLFHSLVTALGDILYGSAASAISVLAGNTTTTRKFLRQVGNGSVSAAPAWDTLQSGDIPQISFTSLSNPPAAETNANDIYSCTSPGGTSAFAGTIATLPGGATLTYNVVSGTEGAMVPTSTSQLAKLRLYNTTRGTNALISNCNTGTNTITLTANVPAGWQVGDTITIASQTVSGGSRSWIDVELTSGPTGKTALFIGVIFSSATAGDNLRIHPFSASFSVSKYIAADALVSSGTLNTNVFGLYTLLSNVISLSWTGTPTNIVLRESGYIP